MDLQQSSAVVIVMEFRKFGVFFGVEVQGGVNCETDLMAECLKVLLQGFLLADQLNELLLESGEEGGGLVESFGGWGLILPELGGLESGNDFCM